MNLTTYLPSLPLANEKMYADCHHCVQLIIIGEATTKRICINHGVLYCIFIIQ